MMVARFGGTYNPCLDHRKMPKWMDGVALPQLHAGPFILFETTVAHDTGVFASTID